MGTYILGQRVWEKSSLLFFLQENFVVQGLPEGSTTRWEGGEATATYVLQARVLFTCNFFWGRSGIFLLMYARVHTCACVCCIFF